jgi:hypothetical protein
MYRWIFHTIRILFGLVFLASGMLKVVAPDRIGISGPPAGRAFIDSMKETGYLYTLLGMTEVVVGLAVIVGLFVPLALTILAPISVNILTYYLFLFQERMIMGVLVVVAHLYLAWVYRESYMALFQARAPQHFGIESARQRYVKVDEAPSLK